MRKRGSAILAWNQDHPDYMQPANFRYSRPLQTFGAQLAHALALALAQTRLSLEPMPSFTNSTTPPIGQGYTTTLLP